MDRELPTLRELCENRGVFELLSELGKLEIQHGTPAIERLVSTGDIRERTWLQKNLADVIAITEPCGKDYIERSGTDHIEAIIRGASFDGRVVPLDFARAVMGFLAHDQ